MFTLTALISWALAAPLAHDIWGADDGLPQVTVQAVLSGSDGYLWVGTQEGLARFDGLEFDVFDKRNTPEMRQHQITALAEDPLGALWVGTAGGGVLRYWKGAFYRYGVLEGMASENVTALAATGAGVWVGTDRGLHLLQDGRAHLIAPSGVTGEIRAITAISDREAILAAERGFFSYTEGTLLSIPLDLPPEAAPLSVEPAKEGGFWLGTSRAGAVRWDGSVRERVMLPNPDDRGTVYDILTDHTGRTWFATLSEGLLYRDTQGQLHAFGPSEGLTYPRVTSLTEDHEGSLWIGTYGGGLNRLRDATFTNLTPREGLPNREVWTVYPDPLGGLWVGTEAGLAWVWKGQLTPFPLASEFAALAVMTALRDPQGGLWFGTWGDGLRKIAQDGTIHAYKIGLPDPRVYHLALSPAGVLWVATQGGLARLTQDGQFTAEVDGLPHRDTRQLLWDSEGVLWVATKGGLAQGLDHGFHHVVLPGIPSHTAISAITLGPDGDLWVATAAGLFRRRGTDWALITLRDGLPDDTLHELIFDARGDLWLTSNRGAFRVRSDDLNAYFSGERYPLRADRFSRDDGMASAECNGGSHPAGTLDADGRLWLPTISGLTSVDPTQLPPEPAPPQVVVERLIADRDEIPLLGEIRLEPGTRDVEILYTGITFLDAKEVEFRLFLHGVDRGPREVGTRRVATYTHLAPGTYTLEVDARHRNGPWTSHPAILRFTILPGFTQTFGFRVAVGFGVGALTWLGLMQWTAAARRREHALIRAVEERTRELRELAEQFESLSVHDPLTGLYNRRYLMDTVGKALESRRSRCERELAALARRQQDRFHTMAIYLVDIDHFKQVNDTWGHDAGDAVLKQFAEVLTAAARSEDIVARWGGEEFLVVLGKTDGRCLGAFAERLRAMVQLREFTLPNGEVIHRTCSVGLARSPVFAAGPCLTLEQVAAVADLGLYEAKRRGRNRSIFIQAGSHPPSDEAALTQALSSLEFALESRVFSIGPLDCSEPCCNGDRTRTPAG